MNKIFETEVFSKLCKDSDKTIQLWVEKVKDQLAVNIFIGKPLHFEWFREKKFGSWRVFSIINKNHNLALLVSLGKKKDQQKIIDHIILNKEYYFRLVS